MKDNEITIYGTRDPKSRLSISVKEYSDGKFVLFDWYSDDGDYDSSISVEELLNWLLSVKPNKE